MARYNGSHTGIVECLLAKVLEKTRGVAERDKFVNALDNGAGFGFAEGYEVLIQNPNSKQEKPKIFIKYHKVDKEGNLLYHMDNEIPEELIDEIIQDGNPK